MSVSRCLTSKRTKMFTPSVAMCAVAASDDGC
jgi:hypothetical protein